MLAYMTGISFEAYGDVHRPKMFIMTDAMYFAHLSRGTSRILLDGVLQAAAKLRFSPTVR